MKRRRNIPVVDGISILAAIGLCLVGGCRGGAESDHDLAAMGVEYRLQIATEPRPNRIHVLRVDLAAGQVRPAVVVAPDPDGDGPAEAALTDPRQMADQPGVIAFVNTNPWRSIPDARGRENRNWHAGQNVAIVGLAVAAGQLRSEYERGVPLWMDHDGVWHLKPPIMDQIREAVSGFGMLVENGEPVPKPGGDLHPRTALGLSRDAQVMWLVVVDGRNSGVSEGMTTHELALIMRDLGCWQAVNMDGGGSSIMGVMTVGQMRVVNQPSDWHRHGMLPSRVRPLPAILTIKEVRNNSG